MQKASFYSYSQKKADMHIKKIIIIKILCANGTLK